VKPLLDRASETARQRGYVMTLLGRRARLKGRFHSALNRIIQGGAADINKRLLIELYRRRKEFGMVMRLTVHDEVMGGLLDRGMQSAIDKLLNTQYFDLRVPILWSSQVGANWAECK
jgi:DNA polymerase-1